MRCQLCTIFKKYIILNNVESESLGFDIVQKKKADKFNVNFLKCSIAQKLKLINKISRTDDTGFFETLSKLGAFVVFLL